MLQLSCGVEDTFEMTSSSKVQCQLAVGIQERHQVHHVRLNSWLA
jgi:hypothetical protein